MSPNHNLLFGILAVQMSFISRDALIQAMNAWVLQKHRSLSDILQEQRALLADLATLLETLVSRHLEAHGNDPEKSLAAIDVSPQMREVLGQVADDRIQQTLHQLKPNYPPGERSTGPFLSREAGSRFRILKLHMTGGLGEVFLAQDLELHRNVALKEIRQEHADNPNSRGRFLLEAEVTGGLEHPNIVPVYGLGAYPDGRPFYAMRFIRGDSLKEAIDRFHHKAPGLPSLGFDSMAFRNLLKRFVDVCNAIAYAHSRGILHRDLKPVNIMLGKYGETLVVDWGLAKPIGRAGPPERPTADEERVLRPTSGSSFQETQAGMAVGTAPYMSPEQAAGHLDELGRTTDVYSLGATLYVLLAGQAPFEGDTAEILRKVEAGEFAAPKEVRSDVPAALNAVVLKAMANRQDDRYPTATALAEEIEHHLADESVLAYPEPWAVEARRWARKHPARVASVTALLLASVVGLLIGSILLSDKNRQLDAANAELTRTNGELDAARKDADSKRQEAEIASGVAIETFNEIVFSVIDKLATRPDTQDLRKDLLDTTRKGLEKLKQGNSARQLHPLAHSHVRMGRLRLELGDTAAAHKEYMTAHEIFQRLARDLPANRQIQRDLGISYSSLGEVAMDMKQTKVASDYFQKGLDISFQLAKTDPKNERYQQDLMIDYNRLGSVKQRMKELAEAFTLYQKGLDIALTLSAADGKSARRLRDVYVGYNLLGRLSLDNEQTEQGFEFFRKGLALTEGLAATDRDNVLTQRDLVSSYEGLGDAKLLMRDRTAALDYFLKQMKIVEHLSKVDSKNVNVHRSLGLCYDKIGDVMFDENRTEEADDFYQKAQATKLKMARLDPNNTSAQREVSAGYGALGRVALKRGQIQKAIDFYLQALEIDKGLAADSDNIDAQIDLFQSYRQLANAERPRDLAAAVSWLEEAKKVLLPLREKKQLVGNLSTAMATVDSQLVGCKNAIKILTDPLSAEQFAPAEQVPALILAIPALIAKKDMAKARLAAELAAKLATALNDRFNAACGFSLLSAADASMKEKDGKRALELLQQAVARGFDVVAGMKSDSDLDPLRNREDFKKLLAELEKKAPPKKP